jgi:beta-carotene 15,15'-dioxygenase
MNNYPSFAIVLSFLGLWITSFFSEDIQVIIGFVLILSFGILHGANDILISKSLANNKNQFSTLKIIYLYVIVVMLGVLLFYFLPAIILLLFVIVSGYHFGEQQLDYIEEFKRYHFVFKTLYGLLVLFLLFGFHINEVIAVVFEITSFKIEETLILYSLYVILILFAINYLLIFLKYEKNKNILLKELFYLLVFSIIFKVSSLIWGFAIYFIVWHSIPSIINQTKFLYGSFDYANFIQYIKAALFYWIISLVGLLFFYLLFQNMKLFNTLFFSFLAAITFPHVLVILKMFGRKY